MLRRGGRSKARRSTRRGGDFQSDKVEMDRIYKDTYARMFVGGRSKARRSTCRRGGRLAASFERDTRWGAPGRN
jgi:hypothetical protein